MSGTYRLPFYAYVTRPMLRLLFTPIFQIFSRVKVIGAENVPRGQAYIAALNHVSIIDPPVALCFWPESLEAIGATDVFTRPIQGQLLKLYGTLPVHRGEYDRALIENILALLKSGRRLMIAPEGGRSHVTAMRRAKPGVGFILQKANVPIVPVGLVGTTEDFIQRGLHGERPRVEMRIGRPIQLPPFPEGAAERREARQQVADLVMRHIAGLLPEEYRGVYAETAIFPTSYSN
ncbi:MAG TPA: lysophospholipid acyltransferase family protein [Anaerolineales bacterium]|nr:lysophospholipid acyltransferase family protein [Anaerolineales bacterium]